MVAFYNKADQELYKDYQFVPQEKYRTGFTAPVQSGGQDASTPSFGVPATNAFTGGGDNFSVYNPDPNSIVNRNYNPRPNYDAYYEDTFGTNLGDPETLAATGAEFYEPPPSKMEGILKMLPYVGTFARGAKFLGDQISPYLPVNRRAILENELGGQGIMVDDIGRIVQGQGAYDTAANVMAGYNANKLTAESFDKRIAMAKEKMSDKNKGARIAALEAAKADFLNAQDKTDKIYDFEEEEKKKKKKDTIVGRYINKKKAAGTTGTDTDNTGTDTVTGNNNVVGSTVYANQNNPSSVSTSGLTYNQGGGSDGSYDFAEQNFGGTNNSQHGSSGMTKSQHSAFRAARGGRAGYFFGGRVNFKNGGLASIL